MDRIQLPQGLSHFEEAVHFFTTKFPEILGTHFIDLWKKKAESILWFWKQDPWIENTAP